MTTSRLSTPWSQESYRTRRSQGGAGMIGWIAGLIGGPMLLAGFAVYVCRGPRRHRRLTREQIAELEILADVERRDDLR
jgi:hypothetical protein